MPDQRRVHYEQGGKPLCGNVFAEAAGPRMSKTSTRVTCRACKHILVRRTDKDYKSKKPYNDQNNRRKSQQRRQKRLYPEHAKLKEIAHLSQSVGEFLEWASGRGYIEVNAGITTMLAEHFQIDQTKIDNEKRAMLAELRNA